MIDQTIENKMTDRPLLNDQGNEKGTGLLALAALLIIFATLGVMLLAQANSYGRATSGNLSAIPQDGRAYFTEPYWQQAAEDAAEHAALSTNLSAIPQDGRAYFTEPYWQQAAEHAAKTQLQTTEPEWSYFTERYWNQSRQGSDK
jgi:hypothetical protein